LLATLNHANVAAIYGLEEADGVRFLVMELVPGQTLAERLAGGPLALDDAVALGKQIAEALEAAHENGIVHRDLKPANIKITPEGKVKLLDFGLAKAFAIEPSAGDATETTGSYDQTREGVILGTPAYMSPEQARQGGGQAHGHLVVRLRLVRDAGAEKGLRRRDGGRRARGRVGTGAGLAGLAYRDSGQPPQPVAPLPAKGRFPAVARHRRRPH
jgi:serine/threonine protein kinase